MRILLAGGAGYIGSALATELLQLGHEIIVIDLLWFGNFLPKGIYVFQKDLFSCTQDDFKDVDQVVFLAGLSNDPMADFSPAKNFIYNGALPSYLAYLAKKAGVRRFIYASSCSVYGNTHNDVYTETSPATSLYPYGISKLQGERGVLQLQEASVFSTIALRQGTVCGYSSRMRFDLILNAMFKDAMVLSQITVNNPEIWRPILSIKDAVRAYIQAINSDLRVNGVFNVASENCTVGQAAVAVKETLEPLIGREIQIIYKNVFDARNYKVSIEKSAQELLINPQDSVQDIIAELFKKRDSFTDYDRDIYYNIRMFKSLNLYS